MTGKFAIDSPERSRYFSSLPKADQQKIVRSEFLVYECVGTETEIKEWFQTVNIAGVPLNKQELLNAIYSGPFVTKAKAEYSNSSNANMQKWRSYIQGDPKRQEILEEPWTGPHQHRARPSTPTSQQHRHDTDIAGLQTYFASVIDWIGSVFIRPPDKEMRGLEWGRLYETYHSSPYKAAEIDKAVDELRADEAVKSAKGIYEYLLGGRTSPQLLDVRLFGEKTKRAGYEQQTQKAKAAGVELSAVCAGGRQRQDADLQAERDGRRPRDRLVEGRGH